MNIFIIVFISIILVWIFLMFKFWKKKYKIAPDKLKFFNKQLNIIVANGSNKEQIIDIDKLYHKVLLEASYSWTFWEILKSEPSEIWDLNKIWELHKLRNKLVHEFDVLSERVLITKANNYRGEIKKLLNHF